MAKVSINGADYSAPVGQYETIAASQTAQVLGTAGAAGDVIHRLVIIPGTTTPGAVTLIDGSTSISIALTGTYTLTPITVELGMRAQTGPWKVTTGANVSVIAVGDFT